jgi:signal transduction histidine kinase
VFPLQLKQKVVAAVGVIVLLFLFGSLLSIEALRSASVQFRSESEFRTALVTLRSLLIDAETGQRGFLASRDPLFLEPYSRAQQTWRRQLAATVSLAPDDPQFHSRLNELQPLIEAKFAELADTMQAAGSAAAPSVERMAAGKATMDRIRVVIGELVSDTEARTVARGNDVNRLVWTAILLVLVSAGISVYAVTSVLREIRLVSDREAADKRAAAEEQELRRLLAAERDRLQDAYRAAATANRAKDEFLAKLSHELRGPLAPIVTVLEVMRQTGSGEERERVVIERQVRHIVRLVDDLLDVSRIASGKVMLLRERTTIGEVINRAREMAAPAIEQRRHELSVDVPGDLFVDADVARLTQVFCNLLVNAAKYTNPGGRIRVDATVEGDQVRVRVIDSGIGIDRAKLPEVFDLFFQEGRDRREADGLGLGLSIVKSLVRLHGGDVFASSDGRGHGSEFAVTLPLLRSGVPSDSNTDALVEPSTA